MKKKIYIVSYVGLSATEYNRNGYNEVHAFQDYKSAKAKFEELKKREIAFLKEEERDYDVLEDTDEYFRIGWCWFDEQVCIRIKEVELF